MASNEQNSLPSLDLPRRWEFLREKAAERGLDAFSVVEPVDSASKRVDALLSKLRSGGGLFEVFLGASGSGKTTFLSSLPKFFERIRVDTFPKGVPLLSLPEFVREGYVAASTDARIILIERRDNPGEQDLAQVEPMMAELLEVFREPEGKALVLWPVTRESIARKIANEAWITGSDSVVDKKTRGLFLFEGVAKADYFRLADSTSRTLTGDGLEAFGLTEAGATDLIASSETIAQFYDAVNEAAEATRDQIWSVLKQRVVPHLWVVLPGDDANATSATASELTQGIRSRVDVDMVGEFIDAPTNNTLYVSDWRKRRSDLANLLRAVDLRLFSLPPNVALAAVRAFGDDTLKSALKSSYVPLDAAKSTMRASRLYKAILQQAGKDVAPFAGKKTTALDTQHEFLRIQKGSARNDKPLNKALGQLIEACILKMRPSYLLSMRSVTFQEVS